jgi:23S rRNA (cytidine1920-2'-O)/16S rRNA (cytidine1409-2'-O)-methyltransferase
VRAADDHRRVVEEIANAGASLNFHTQGVIESPVLGAKGNREFLIYLRLPETPD